MRWHLSPISLFLDLFLFSLSPVTSAKAGFFLFHFLFYTSGENVRWLPYYSLFPHSVSHSFSWSKLNRLSVEQISVISDSIRRWIQIAESAKASLLPLLSAQPVSGGEGMVLALFLSFIAQNLAKAGFFLTIKQQEKFSSPFCGVSEHGQFYHRRLASSWKLPV